MASYMTDKRLVNHKDYTQDSKYSGTYMIDKEFYNNAKPFVHLKIDQICRRTMPKDIEGYDYEIIFNPYSFTFCLMLETEDSKAATKLYEWEQKVSELIDSAAIKEFGATDAYPEDERISRMLRDLSIKLDNTPIDQDNNCYMITVLAKF